MSDQEPVCSQDHTKIIKWQWKQQRRMQSTLFSTVTWKEGEKHGRGMLKEKRRTGKASNSISILQKLSFIYIYTHY